VVGFHRPTLTLADMATAWQAAGYRQSDATATLTMIYPLVTIADIDATITAVCSQ